MTSPMDMMRIQAQIRQNATEMADYFKDLNDWEKEICQKDQTYWQSDDSSISLEVPWRVRPIDKAYIVAAPSPISRFAWPKTQQIETIAVKEQRDPKQLRQ